MFARLSALCWGWFPCCTEFKFQESQKGTFPVYQRPFVWRLKKKGRKRKESVNYCRSTLGKVIGRKFVCATWDMIVRLLSLLSVAQMQKSVYSGLAGYHEDFMYEDNGYPLKI